MGKLIKYCRNQETTTIDDNGTLNVGEFYMLEFSTQGINNIIDKFEILSQTDTGGILLVRIVQGPKSSPNELRLGMGNFNII